MRAAPASPKRLWMAVFPCQGGDEAEGGGDRLRELVEDFARRLFFLLAAGLAVTLRGPELGV